MDRQRLWATVDAPWLTHSDLERFAGSLAAVRALSPELITSSHLPPARGMTEGMLATLASLPGAPAFVGPDQSAIERLLSSQVREEVEAGHP